MKKILLIIPILLIAFNSCELDNYDAPDAKIFGSVIDEETGDPIPQEILEGSRVDYVELGYENPPTQQLRFKTDGSYRNDLMFSGMYHIQARRGNFFMLPPDTIQVKGETEHNFVTLPYIRIKEVDYSIANGYVVATFRVEQIAETPVKSIALFADMNPNVSFSLRQFATILDINSVVDSENIFTLKMKIEPFKNIQEKGKPVFFFRVGALISDMPEAKYNYSLAKGIEIDYDNLPPEEPEIEGNVLDDCESLDGWGSGGFKLSLDVDSKQGNFSLNATGEGVVVYQKEFEPFDTKVDKESGTFAFSLYISDTSLIGDADGNIEITSSGQPDVAELAWSLNSLNLNNGWNSLELKLKDANVSGGDIDLKAVNFFRFYHTGLKGPMIFKIDNIRFY